MSCDLSMIRALLPEFKVCLLPLITWINGFLDWISMECIFKILQFHNLWDNECKMDEYCFRFALWRWNSPFVEASAEHKWSERFIAMFNATKHNIRPFHIHVFVNMSDCNILFITEIIKFNLKIRNTTCKRQFLSETPANYLFDRLQICIFSASAISSSRKSGWATEINASAFCQEESPLRFTIPYSVTT